MRRILTYIFELIFLGIILMGVPSCSNKDEEVRMPSDILGVWTDGENHYQEFSDDNLVHNLQVEYQDDMKIGRWKDDDVYYYEPGYNLVIYISSNGEINVYEVTRLDSKNLTWCWVDKIDITSGELTGSSKEIIGRIIGDIIKKAQEGYKLDPELYQSFSRLSEDEYLALLESLDIIYYPWDVPWEDDPWGDDPWED